MDCDDRHAWRVLDHFQMMRLRLILLALLAALACSVAYAASSIAGWKVSTSSFGTTYGTTQAAACSAQSVLQDSLNSNSDHVYSYDVTFQFDSPELPQCNIYINGTKNNVTPIQSASTCGDGSAPDTSKPLEQQCSSLPPPVVDATWEYREPDGYAPYPSPDEACKQQFYGPWRDAATAIPNGDGSYRCESNANGQNVKGNDVQPELSCPFGYHKNTSDLGKCVSDFVQEPPTEGTPDVQPTKDAGPQAGSCPAGSVNIGTKSDGTPLCAQKSDSTPPAQTTTSETTSPTTETNNPDGSTTKTDVTTRVNKDGSTTTTTTTTTTQPDGTKTVNVTQSTGTKPEGGQGKADEGGGGGGGAGGLCETHPELNICKNSDVGGDCESGISCSGDAIQCAILRQQKKEYCELAKENALRTLGEQAISGNDPLASTLPTKENAAQVAMPSMDQSGWLGGGSCFPDTTFTVMGQSITIPWSEACQYLIVFRYVMMIVALFTSFRILSGAIMRE